MLRQCYFLFNDKTDISYYKISSRHKFGIALFLEANLNLSLSLFSKLIQIATDILLHLTQNIEWYIMLHLVFTDVPITLIPTTPKDYVLYLIFVQL